MGIQPVFHSKWSNSTILKFAICRDGIFLFPEVHVFLKKARIRLIMIFLPSAPVKLKLLSYSASALYPKYMSASAFLRSTRPDSTLPPAYTHFSNSCLIAGSSGFLLTFFSSVDE